MGPSKFLMETQIVADACTLQPWALPRGRPPTRQCGPRAAAGRRTRPADGWRHRGRRPLQQLCCACRVPAACQAVAVCINAVLAGEGVLGSNTTHGDLGDTRGQQMGAHHEAGWDVGPALVGCGSTGCQMRQAPQGQAQGELGVGVCRLGRQAGHRKPELAAAVAAAAQQPPPCRTRQA